MRQLTKEEFIRLYNELSINELAYYCEVSRVTITNWAKKFNLPQKRPRLIKK